MRPAILKAPLEFLFAFAISALIIGTSFAVKPSSTMWVVMAVGIAMAVTVAIAAVKPIRG
jgi:uncharacterized protein (DUF983 family)